MKKPIKVIRGRIVYQNPWMKVREDVVEFPNGKRGIYGLVEKDDFSLIIPFDGEKFYQLGLFQANLKEMTGAGDAYATGVIAGLFHGKDLPEAMRWGAANGAAVVEQIGPQAGLLTLHQMQERLKENSKIVAKEI